MPTSNKPLINFKRLVVTIWILLWVILIMLLIGKVLFHQWYPIVINNQHVLNICNFIDNHIVLRKIINCIFYCLNVLILVATCTSRKRLNIIQCIYLISFAVVTNSIKDYNNYIGFIPEFVLLIVLPSVINFKQKLFKRKFFNILFPVIINVLTMLWQLNILLIRDVNDLLKEIPTFISYTLQIDYYIFLIITWEGVVYIMSTIGVWFFGKSLTELKAMKAKELEKVSPDKEYLAKLDKEIAKREGE